MARLRRKAEEAKILLSSETRTVVTDEFVAAAGGKSSNLALEITRHAFERHIDDLLARTIRLTKRALTDANLSAQDISRVCLVGGSTRIPRVRALIADLAQ